MPVGAQIIADWPVDAQEAARLVLDTYGEPQEASASVLVWHDAGDWELIMASRAFSRAPS